jgi:hypothetical protein
VDNGSLKAGKESLGPSRTVVFVEVDASTDDIAATRAAFLEAGLDANVSAGYARFSAGDLPPITIVVSAVSALLGALVGGMAGAAGKDLYVVLKRLVVRAVARPTRSRLPIAGAEFLLQDRENGFELLFHGDEPDEAYVELFDIELEEEFAGAGVVAWSDEANTWRPVGASSFRLAPGRSRGRRARDGWP